MQTIKEKLSHMSATRKAKAEAKEEENEEKELAKARMEVAHEVKMAREAEAQMDLHVNKAVQKASEFEQKHPHHIGGGNSTAATYGGSADSLDCEIDGFGSDASARVDYTGGPPTHNKLL